MIVKNQDPIALTPAYGQEPIAAAPRKVLRMTHNDRTAGAIPVWEDPATATQDIEANLAEAGNNNPQRSFAATLAYQQGAATADAPRQGEEFGFGDIIDMVNPLQHIPLVGHIYREITGDDIKPVSQIIGGAVFGGGIGAAASLVNVVIEEETGDDLTGNALAFVQDGKTPSWKKAPNDPEIRLAAAINRSNDFSNALLAFTDLRNPSGFETEKRGSFNPYEIY